MASIGPTIQKLARKIVQGNTPALAPRAPQLNVHHLTVTHVDQFSGTVNVQFPDPSGNGPVASGVSIVQPYSSDNIPAVGDTAVVHQYGTDLYVMGEHVRLTNFVTPT